MRILLISDVYFPRVNGVSTSIQTFAHQQLALGHEIRLIAPEYPFETEDEFPIYRVQSRVVPFDTEDRLMRKRFLRGLYPELAQWKPDLVHIQTPFRAHYEGIRLGRHLQVPIIETYHTYFEEYLENYLPFLPRLLLRFAARRFTVSQCKQVDTLVVPSQPIRDVLFSYGVTRQCHVIPTGIPTTRFSGGDGEAFRSKHQIENDRPLLLYVGRVAHEKNIGFLIDVVERVRRTLPEVLLVIAGEGPARKPLQEAVSNRDLQSNVRFVGYLSREKDLPGCYAAGDAFVFASRTETQGLVLLESMAAGTPVVTTAVLGTASVMHDAKGGIVVDEELNSFSAAVLKLLGDPALKKRLSDDALAKAREWSDRELAKRMLKLYQTTHLVASHPATA